MFYYSKFLLMVLLFFSMANESFGQAKSLSLEKCYELTTTNYPAFKKRALNSQAGQLDIKNAGKNYLPQLNFSGQASFQSQALDFSDAFAALPAGTTLPSISQDQYKIQGEISQLLYDGGWTKDQKELLQVNSNLKQQNLAISLYTLKNRVNNLFFSILLMDAQLKQNALNRSTLQTQVQKTKVALENGTQYRSNLDELKAEVINIDMQATKYTSNRIACLKMLSLYIGKPLPNDTQLTIPEIIYTPQKIIRPELKAFDLQKSVYDIQEKQLKSEYLPHINAFFQGAYGRPTLNMIENKFGPWYITGIRLNWSLGSLYQLNNKKSILSLNRQSTEADKATFLFNTHLELIQQDEDIKKYTQLIIADDQAIAIRSSISEAAEAQLKNGIITIHEYIQKLNAENLARQSKNLHQIQLLQARYNQRFISGHSYKAE